MSKDGTGRCGGGSGGRLKGETRQEYSDRCDRNRDSGM